MSHAACGTSSGGEGSSSSINNNHTGDNNISRVESPMKQLKFHLDKYKIKDALQIFFSDSTIRLAEEPDFMWDVIPLICNRLRGLCQYRFRVFEGCERMLCCLAEDVHCNPKEVLIGLLAEINQTEHREDDNVFRAMIRPLQGALLRMSLPSPREENFRWTLNVLMRHINDTPLPQEYNIEGNKRLSLPNDSNVKRFIETLPLMLSFIEELNDKPIDYDKSPMPILTESQIDEVLNGELVDDDDFMSDDHAPVRSDITDASITALLRLIQRPLTFLDVTPSCKELRTAAVRCLGLLLRLMPDLFSPIYKQSKLHLYGCSSKQLAHELANEDTAIDVAADIISSNISPLATNHFEGSISNAMLTLATCAYLYRCEVRTHETPTPLSAPPSSAAAISNLVAPLMPTTPLAIDMTQYFPQILTHESLLYCHMPFIMILLKRPEILAHEKGLNLLGHFISMLPPNSKGQRLLDMFKSSSLIEQLFQIMIHSPLSDNRRHAYDHFTVICDLLTYDCKLDLFKWILKQSDLKPCIRAACIDQYRRHLSIIHKELMELNQRLAFVRSLSSDPSSEPSSSAASSHPKPSNAEQMKIVSGLLERLTYCEDAHQDPYDIPAHEFTAESLREFTNVSKQLDARHENIWLMSRETMRRINIWQARYNFLGGQQLVEFLDLSIAACLPESQHTDIIENNDLILATLTMFRYLRLRKPLVKDEVEQEYLSAKRLKKRFFNPIRNALAMIKGEINTASCVASGESSSTGAAEADAECLNFVLCRVDLVESVLVRTCDLYDC